MDNIKHIKNPLSLISIFAGVAEVSGVAVLPLISTPENQYLYIWFLIFFPTFTVTLFFITLNFNYKTLYAPSDYRDEKNFVNPFGTATDAEVVSKLKAEALEVRQNNNISQTPRASSENSIKEAPEHPRRSGIESQPAPAPSLPPTVTVDEPQVAVQNRLFKTASFSALSPNTVRLMEPYKSQHRALMESVAIAEKLAIQKLGKIINLEFKPDVAFTPENSTERYIFDAAAHTPGKIDIVEIKLFTHAFDPNRFNNALSNAYYLNLTLKGVEKLTLHCVIVMKQMRIRPSEIRTSMARLTQDYKFDTRVHITTTEALESQEKPFLR
jgi:hypothetical protein